MRIKDKISAVTLIELVIFIAIIAIAVPSLLALFNHQLKMLEKSRVITQATYLAQQIMEEEVFARDFYELRGTDPQGNTLPIPAGTFGADFPRYKWQIITRSVNAEANDFDALSWGTDGGFSNYLRVEVVVFQDINDNNSRDAGETGVNLVTLVTPSGPEYYEHG